MRAASAGQRLVSTGVSWLATLGDVLRRYSFSVSHYVTGVGSLLPPLRLGRSLG